MRYAKMSTLDAGRLTQNVASCLGMRVMRACS